MMKSELIKVVAGLLVLALIGPSLLGSLAYVTSASSDNNVDTSSQAALKFILRIEIFINNTLRLASNYNITIPEDLQGNITVAQSLIQQAKEIVEENPGEAVSLALKASRTFAPVAIYVHQQLPENYKVQLEKKQIELAIEHREKLVQRLQIMLKELNQTGVNVSEEWTKLKIIQQTLQEAHIALQNGNYQEAFHKVMIVDTMTKKEIKITITNKMIILKGRQAASYAVRALVAQMSSIANIINITVNKINETGTVDENITQLIHVAMIKNNVTLRHVNKILELIDENKTNQTIVEALYLIQASLESSGTYLEQAYNYSLEGNASMVVYDLSQAYTVLNTTIEQIREMNILPPRDTVWIMIHVKKIDIEIIIEKHCHYEGNWTQLMQQLNRTYTHLQQAYEKYQQGHMSKMRYKAIIMAEKQQLEIIKHRIGNNAPEDVVNMINEILEWINTHQP